MNNQMTELQRMVQAIQRGGQYTPSMKGQGMLSRSEEDLTFGGSTNPNSNTTINGSDPYDRGNHGAFGLENDVNSYRDNPNGVTGVAVTGADGAHKLGFSGNPEHFMTGQAARDLIAGSQGSPFGGNYQGGAPVVPEAPAESQGINLGQRQSTPFLDSYMRAREASRSTGPVSQTMKKYMEE